MEHETGSGWTRSPAQVSDENNGGNGADNATAAGTGRAAGSGTEGDGTIAASGGNDRAPATPATGEPRVDAALRLLERLPGMPVSEHPQLFEQVHAQLSEVLGELDSGSMPGPAGR